MQDKITIADAPDCLNTNDKAMWVLGYVAAIDGRSQCLHQIQEPSPVLEAPKLDEAWKARMLDGQPLLRDKDGIGFHPALPDFDESTKCADFFAALGIELKGGRAENEMDSDAYEAMTGNGLTDANDNYNAWTPMRPEGEGWNLVAVFDTEDGPACWWMRDMPFVPQRSEGYRERVDNAAVEVLSMNMKAKLAGQRAKGYRGWNNDCTQQRLSDLLRECVEKGDPVDVANFCAFLLSRGETIAPRAAPAAVAVPDGLKLVPVDLTPEMKREFMDLLMDGIDIYVNRRDQIEIQTDAPRRIWKAVLALAPSAPADALATATGLPAQAVDKPEGVHADPYPRKCPITGRPYFMHLQHPEHGLIPTFGGPYDSYSMPYAEGEPTDQWHERELSVHRYDHDRGHWVEDESITLRIIFDEVLWKLQEASEAAPQAQADAGDAEITWPKARDVGRFDDMSPGDSIRVGLDSDNDVYVSVCGGGGVGSVEFCNPGGGGGGRSSRTRLALLALMVAMEADNADDPARDWWARRNTKAAQGGE